LEAGAPPPECASCGKEMVNVPIVITSSDDLVCLPCFCVGALFYTHGGSG